MGYERSCFEEFEDDGNDLLTIELHSETQDRVLTLNADQRKLVAGEGWATFVDFDVPMYRNGPRFHPQNN